MENFALPDQVRHAPGHFLRGRGRVYTVLEVEVDAVRPKPPEGALHGFLDALRAGVGNQGVGHDTRVGVEADAKLRDDLHLVPDGLEGLACQTLIGMRIILGAVDLGGIEKRITRLRRSPQKPDSFFFSNGAP